MLWCNANFPQPEKKKKKKKVGLRKWKEINYTNNVGSYELPYFSPFTCLKTVLTLFRYHQITLSCIILDQLPLQKYNNAHRSQNNPPTTHMTLHWSHTLLLPHLPNPNTKIIPLPVSYMFLMLVGPYQWNVNSIHRIYFHWEPPQASLFVHMTLLHGHSSFGSEVNTWPKLGQNYGTEPGQATLSLTWKGDISWSSWSSESKYSDRSEQHITPRRMRQRSYLAPATILLPGTSPFWFQAILLVFSF